MNPDQTHSELDHDNHGGCAANCRAVIYQNFYGSLTVDAIGMVLASLGFLNPLLAAFIHVTSELTFILNPPGYCPFGDHRNLRR